MCTLFAIHKSNEKNNNIEQSDEEVEVENCGGVLHKWNHSVILSFHIKHTHLHSTKMLAFFHCVCVWDSNFFRSTMSKIHYHCSENGISANAFCTNEFNTSTKFQWNGSSLDILLLNTTKTTTITRERKC